MTLPGVELDSVSFAPRLETPGRAARPDLRRGLRPERSATPSLPAALPLPRQQDLGYDGPGSVVLASCGPPLYGAYGSNLVPWRVTGGPPFASASLRIGALQPAFDANLGAWVVSSAPAFTLPFRLDASGAYTTTSWTGNTSRELHYQVVVADPAQTRGFSVSNALKMNLLGTYMRAVRNRRFKLIRQDPCHEELYDLVADPFENTDLLRSPLGPQGRAAYLELSSRLDALH